MDHITVGRCWDDNAEAWTTLSRMGCDAWRNLVNAPAFIKMLPDVKDLRGLDVGCGEGYNTRLVADLGAKLEAFDISRKFVCYASEEARRTGAAIRHLNASALFIPFMDGSFDFVMSTMALMDMPDHEGSLSEIRRVLKPGGFFQFSISHPVFNMGESHWASDVNGLYTGWEIRNYFQPMFGVTEEWRFSRTPPELMEKFKPFIVPRFERTLSGWLNLIADAGFIMERFDEPHPEGEAIKAFPRHPAPPTVPFSLIIRCRKPFSTI